MVRLISIKIPAKYSKSCGTQRAATLVGPPDPEDECTATLQKIGKNSPKDTAPHLRKPES
jgi:hypothetical protein